MGIFAALHNAYLVSHLQLLDLLLENVQYYTFLIWHSNCIVQLKSQMLKSEFMNLKKELKEFGLFIL